MKPIPPVQKSNQKAPTLEFNQGVRAELYFQLPDLGSNVVTRFLLHRLLFLYSTDARY